MQQGDIYDITDAVKIVPGADDGTFGLNLTASSLQGPALSAADLGDGFDIHMKGFDGDHATFEGTIKKFPWKGTYVGFSKIPFQTVRDGRKEIPADVQAFFKISPILSTNGNAIDQARQWTGDIFQDVFFPKQQRITPQANFIAYVE